MFFLVSVLGHLNQNLQGETQASGNCIFFRIQSAKLFKKKKNPSKCDFGCLTFPYELSQKFLIDQFQSLETLISGKLGKIPLEGFMLPAISVNFEELLTVVESINTFKWKVA